MNTAPVSEYDDNEIVNHSPNTHMDTILAARLSRRGALKGGIGATTAALLGSVGLSACGGSDDEDAPAETPAALNFAAVAKTNADLCTVPPGYQVSILHALGDPMMFGDGTWSDAGTETAESYDRRIGDGHDGMYYFGLSDAGKFDANRSDRGLLCVNHEYVVQPYGLHPAGSTSVDGKRPADEVEKEIRAHGVSVVEVKRKAGSNDMEMVRGSKYNRRVTSATEMDFGGPAAGNAKLVNKLSPNGKLAFGMNNNCANGYTPWGTYLTCEENYLNVIGRAAGDDAQRSASEIVALKRYGLPEGRKNPYGWDTPEGEQYQRWNSKVSGASAAEDHRNSFNTFGWVVEIDPFRPDSKPVKRSALGRFNHEGAWPAPAKAGEPIVIYSGDDARNEYVFKFVSDAKWDPKDIDGGTAVGAKYLDHGKLYAARFSDDGTGVWLELTHGKNGIDANNALYPFADQGDVLMHCRLAADFMGATKMDRPEWGGVNPLNNEVYMTMTNNSQRDGEKIPLNAANPRKGNKNGHIIRWKENGGQTGTKFEWDVYLFGAREDGSQSENLSGLTAVNDFSSPDGLYFDQRSGKTDGLLWIQTDDGAYTDVTNCMMLAALPGAVGDGGKIKTREGQDTIMGAKASDANVRRFLVGPFDCEITGVVVTPDGKTLFFNVQHPGEDKGDFTTNTFTSHWPGSQAPASDALHHGHKRPRSATVVVTRTDGGTIGI
ncbi:PhoX family phosphatase [Ottowia sp.]|uniref:PhoX family protein n=2 Tax=Ottowia sp. TaxID=1898956 RepID=UPI002C84BC3B|nr:PhoX family phosphatase [Ottowia sp.]HRN76635.1 PhoX family phosphatase [Ottowia sp.]